MARKYSNPMTNPLHYGTPQLLTGAPATYTTAQRKLLGYDYGKPSPPGHSVDGRKTTPLVN